LADKKIKAQNRIKNIKNNTTLEKLTKKGTFTKNFTYHPWANNKFQKIFKEFNITLAPFNKFNIKNVINANYKDTEPPFKKSGIYKINCKQCTLERQKRNLETRTIEHFRNLRLNHTDQSFLEHRT
jgi:hypothetical protein